MYTLSPSPNALNPRPTALKPRVPPGGACLACVLALTAHVCVLPARAVEATPVEPTGICWMSASWLALLTPRGAWQQPTGRLPLVSDREDGTSYDRGVPGAATAEGCDAIEDGEHADGGDLSGAIAERADGGDAAGAGAGEGLLLRASLPNAAENSSCRLIDATSSWANAPVCNEVDARDCVRVQAVGAAGPMLYPEIEMLDPLSAWRRRERARKLEERKRRAMREHLLPPRTGQPSPEQSGRNLHHHGSGENGVGQDGGAESGEQINDCGIDKAAWGSDKSISQRAVMVEVVEPMTDDEHKDASEKQSRGAKSDGGGEGARGLGPGCPLFSGAGAGGTVPGGLEMPRIDSPSPLEFRGDKENAPNMSGGASIPPPHREAASSLQEPLGSSNKGFELLRRMGWSGGGVGAQEQGRADPVAVDVRAGRLGLGATDVGGLEATDVGARWKEAEGGKDDRQRALGLHPDLQRKSRRGQVEGPREQEFEVAAGHKAAREPSLSTAREPRKRHLSPTYGSRNFADLSARLGAQRDQVGNRRSAEARGHAGESGVRSDRRRRRRHRALSESAGSEDSSGMSPQCPRRRG